MRVDAGLDNTITNPHGIEFYNKFIDELIANGKINYY